MRRQRSREGVHETVQVLVGPAVPNGGEVMKSGVSRCLFMPFSLESVRYNGTDPMALQFTALRFSVCAATVASKLAPLAGGRL